MDDYYSGADGARRLISELDVALQHMIESLDSTSSLECDIAVRLANGESVELNKTYRHRPRTAPEPV